MFVLMEEAAQAITSTDAEMYDLVWVGDWLGRRMQRSSVR
jgi:hypothetical protein